MFAIRMIWRVSFLISLRGRNQQVAGGSVEVTELRRRREKLRSGVSLIGFDEISLDLVRISLDLSEISLKYGFFCWDMENCGWNLEFFVGLLCFFDGFLFFGFQVRKTETDLPESVFGVEDPLLTVGVVRSVVVGQDLVGFLGEVWSRIILDTLNLLRENLKHNFIFQYFNSTLYSDKHKFNVVHALKNFVNYNRDLYYKKNSGLQHKAYEFCSEIHCCPCKINLCCGW